MKQLSQNHTEKTQLDIEMDVIMDHILLILGFVFNFLIIVVIVFNNSMHKSTSCYILSFILTNYIILLDSLKNILTWWYNIDMFLDMQYIIDMCFKASILTLVMLTIDRYIYICSKQFVYNHIHIIVPKFKTAAKSVIVIWIMTFVITAMELHLCAQFKWDENFVHKVEPSIQIFLISTFIFLVIPIILIIFLGSLIIYELEQLKVIREVDKEDVESLRILAGLMVGFLITMVPYRVALVINYIFPKICSDNLKIYVTIVKGTTIVLPLICFVTSTQFRITLKNTIFCCRCRIRKAKKHKETMPQDLVGETID